MSPQMTPKNPFIKIYILVMITLLVIGALAYMGVQYGTNYVNSNGRLPFISR